MNIFTIFQSKQFSGKLTISGLREKRWIKSAQADLPQAGYGGLRVIKQQLWCCCGEAGIMVFDSALQKQRIIPVQAMKGVNDVAEISNGDVLIAAWQGIYHADASGK